MQFSLWQTIAPYQFGCRLQLIKMNFFLGIMSGSDKLLVSRFIFPVIYEVIYHFSSSINSGKNVVIQILQGQCQTVLPEPNRRGLKPSLRQRDLENVPIFVHLPRRILRPWTHIKPCLLLWFKFFKTMILMLSRLRDFSVRFREIILE